MGDTPTTAADLPARIAAARADVDETRTAYRLAVELRNALVVAAVDEGYRHQSVADLAGIDRKTMSEVVARADAHST